MGPTIKSQRPAMDVANRQTATLIHLGEKQAAASTDLMMPKEGKNWS